MSDPQRLISDSSSSKIERLLLEAWQDERPPVDGRNRTLAALGIASGAAAIGGVTSLGSVAPKALAATTFSLWKWLLLLSVLALSVSGAALVALKPLKSEPVSQTSTAPTITTLVGPISSAAPTSSPVVPQEAIAPSIPKSAASTSAATTRTSDSLRDEIAAIDDARTALDAGDFKRADALAIGYERRFPRGAFGEEAQTIRIAAVVQGGDTAKAHALAAKFIEAHPLSRYVPRVRNLVDR